MKTTTENIEKDLWNAMRIGNKKALDQLYLTYHPRLISYARKYTLDYDLVKDCIHTLFLYIWEKRDTLTEANHVGNYIVKSFQRNLIKQLLLTTSTVPDDKSLLKQRKTDFIQKSEEENIIDKEDNMIRIYELKKAIENLPKRQRSLIYFKFYEGLSYEEITEKTGITKRTAYNHLHRAIETLRKNDRLSDLTYLFILF